MNWDVSVYPAHGEVRLLVTDRASCDLLKARLPQHIHHPRALLTLLEGVALWQGAPLDVAITADASCQSWRGSGLFGNELWPGESQLVRFSVVPRARPKRLAGLGSFRDLRGKR